MTNINICVTRSTGEEGSEQPQLVLLYFMAQLLLRELAKCHRLVQLVPMDMTSYYGKLILTYLSRRFFLGRAYKY